MRRVIWEVDVRLGREYTVIRFEFNSREPWYLDLLLPGHEPFRLMRDQLRIGLQTAVSIPGLQLIPDAHWITLRISGEETIWSLVFDRSDLEGVVKDSYGHVSSLDESSQFDSFVHDVLTKCFPGYVESFPCRPWPR